MKRCPKCNYFVENTLALGGCYCGFDSSKLGNLHDIDSFQAVSITDPLREIVVGTRLYYNNTMDPYFAYASRIYDNYREWLSDFAHPDRFVKIWYKAGHVKAISFAEFKDIVIKDGHLPKEFEVK